ncbi:MAG TPA: DNA recombination protein RmuC, partial [Clostridia bacterium]|nr:DNA recombination protein RmuC [Clostridia bacterium]
LGMVESLQREFRVNIAGPSTMAALLNSLQMGFRTVAIQKRSGEVWKVLGAVKTEFERFDKVLLSAQDRLDRVHGDLDTLIGRRTRSIRRTLRGVESLPEAEAPMVLAGAEFEDAEECDG